MGFQFGVMFIDSFTDVVICVRDVSNIRMRFVFSVEKSQTLSGV